MPMPIADSGGNDMIGRILSSLLKDLGQTAFATVLVLGTILIPVWLQANIALALLVTVLFWVVLLVGWLLARKRA